ncbi:hypothetical protein M9H77_23177 [Catharanthus roseus]|uniref:Uncharacterized protein n=1 Tax=Catharanthus roseus TaxID=4058 RepID=A0ACC0AUQ6_CATRO|nr:hypothetical protein M9H77_23177 [Catharanthus roseus]
MSTNAQFRSQLRSLSESRDISAASTPKFKKPCNATVGLHKQGLDPKTRPSEPSSGGRTPLQSMMRCPRRPIGPHPPQSMPFFKWIHSPESETSMPSEEAFVRGLATKAICPAVRTESGHKYFSKNPHPPVTTCSYRFHNHTNARSIFMHVKTFYTNDILTVFPCFSVAIPIKYSIFMWKLTNNFLVMDSARQKLGFHLTSQCRCENGSDDLNHVSWLCSFAQETFFRLLHDLGLAKDFHSFHTLRPLSHVPTRWQIVRWLDHCKTNAYICNVYGVSGGNPGPYADGGALRSSTGSSIHPSQNESILLVQLLTGKAKIPWALDRLIQDILHLLNELYA